MTESNIRKNYLAEFLQNGLIDEEILLLMLDKRYTFPL